MKLGGWAITNLSVDKPILPAPNHEMVAVTVSYNVTDDCGPVTASLSVTSNESVDGIGDGDTAPDWEIVDAHHVLLRAERSGTTSARVYTITITAVDSSGNSSSATVTVEVRRIPSLIELFMHDHGFLVLAQPRSLRAVARLLLLTAALVACHASGENMQQDSSTYEAPSAQLYAVEVDGKYGFIDEEGNLKFTLPADVYTVGQFSEDLAVVAKRFEKIYGRWGYIDQTGKVVIENKFNLAKTFSEGLAAVIVGEGPSSAGGKIGYIDRTGRMVIQPQFDQAGVETDYAFSEGLAAVPREDAKWGYIDKTGKFVIQPQFHLALPFSEGRAIAGIAEPDYAEAKYGFIDKQGRWIVAPRYESVDAFSEGLAAIEVGHKVGFIDLEGKTVIKPQFDTNGRCPDSQMVNKFSEGLAPVAADSKWGFIDRTGKWVIKPAFDCAMPFSDGLALVGVRDEKGGWLLGYVDKTGATVIKPQFSQAGSFNGKLARVWIGMSEDEALLKALREHQAGKRKEEIEQELEKNKPKYGFIDRSGKLVWKQP
jgi:hypothetical protein